MAASDDEIRENLRESIKGLVITLASSEELLEYSSWLGNAVGEVYCQWFDDLYHPEYPLFQSAFSPETLKAFDRVNAALVSCKELVDEMEIRAILQSPCWQAVQSAAQRALQQLEGKSDRNSGDEAEGERGHS